MKKTIIFLLIIIVIVGIGGWALMTAYASSIDIEDPAIWLYEEKGSVYYNSDGEGFINVSGETPLMQGDSVKTDENSKAKIVFYDSQEIILDENTEIEITKGVIDENSPLLTKVKVNLKEGQVWSRLLELLHPDAAFEVEADNVVATVRGTSFNVSYLGDEVNVAVFENSISVSDEEGEVEVNEEDVLIYQPVKMDDTASADEIEALKRSRFQKRKLRIDERKQAWVKNNIERDLDFKEEISKRRKRILNQVGPLPGDKFYKLKRLSEKISLMTAFDKYQKEKVSRNIKIKRLLEIEALIESGRKDQALTIINAIDIDPQVLPIIQRIKALDPKIKENLMQDEEIKNFYLNNIFDDNQRDFLINRIFQNIRTSKPRIEQAIENIADELQKDTFENNGDINLKNLKAEMQKINLRISNTEQQINDLFAKLEQIDQTQKDRPFSSKDELEQYYQDYASLEKKLNESQMQLQNLKKEANGTTNDLNVLDELLGDELYQYGELVSDLSARIFDQEYKLESIKTDMQNFMEKFDIVLAEEEGINLLGVTFE